MTRNGKAGWLGLILGPVGFWYKHQWMTGWAWLAILILAAIGTGGILNFFLCIPCAIHAYRVNDLVEI